MSVIEILTIVVITYVLIGLVILKWAEKKNITTNKLRND